MKKFSLQFLTAFVTGNNDRIKASRIFFLAFLFSCISNFTFAQVIVTPAPDGGALCGPLPGCMPVGDIIIRENLGSDFAPGTSSLSLIPPAGWEFCASPTYTITIAGDVTAVNPTGYSITGFSFNVVSGGNSQIDEIKIVGLSVVPLTPSSAPGFISATISSGINGITIGTGPGGTNFGNLALFPGIISGNLSICANGTTQLSSSSVGGVWSITPAVGVATIDPVTGAIGATSATTQTADINYTIGGCYATAKLTVNENPTTILATTPPGPLRDICQNNCYEIRSTPSTGLFTSTLVTVTNIGPIGTTGRANLCGVPAGQGSITYTLPSGCFVTGTMTVNPIPQPIIDPLGTFEICAGDTRTLSDATPGGTWSSQFIPVASIDAGTGFLTAGANPGGVTRITYTLATGCAIDTPFRVYPVPGNITGVDVVCVGSTTRLSNATTGGTWTSASTGIATVDPVTGIVTGVTAGTVDITYTLALGNCFRTFLVTVNPIPDVITGPHEVCVSSQITLFNPTPGGTWSSSSTVIATVGSTTGVVTGVSSGGPQYISYTLPTGCFVTHSLTVNPVPDTIRGATRVCQGQCTILSTASFGGTWSSQLPGFVSIDPNTGQACGLQVATVIVTYSYPTGCFQIHSIDVDPLDSITGPKKVCERDSILLINTTAGGGTWSSSNPAVGTVNSTTGMVTGGSVSGVATTVVISFTSSTGCVATTTITVNPAPGPITGAPNVCTGSQILLSDAAAGTVGSWGTTNPVVATVVAGPGDVGVVTGGVPGYSVLITYTLPSGCFSEHLVKVDSLPFTIIGPGAVCKGDSITLINLYPHATGTWSSTDTLIARVDSLTGVVTGIDTGTVVISYILPSGCFETHSVTVNHLDTTFGPQIVCAADSIQLFNNTAHGPGTWSSSNTAIATVGANTGKVYGVHPGGVVTITYTLPTGCLATYTVLVNPQPDVFVGPNQVCQGWFITLSSNPAGTWSSSNPTVATIDPVSGLIGGVNPGIDTITYTLIGTGCIRTATITVNPRTPIIVGNGDSVCVGSTLISLSDATPGGVWSSANTGIATVNSANGNVTGVSEGSVTITYTTAQGCIDTTIIKVNRLPYPIVGADTICAGSQIQLSTIDSTGVWSVTPPTVATIDTTGLVTGIQPGGVATITYTLPSTCATTTTLLVNPLPPAIVGPRNICINDSTQVFTNIDTNGLWSTTDTFLFINDTTGLVFPSDTGVTIIRYTYPATGCFVSATVTIRPLPVLTISQSDSIICKGAFNTLYVSGADTLGTYVWSPVVTPLTADGDTVRVSPLVSTIYTVTGTTQYGCSSTDTIMVWVDSTLNHLAISADDTDLCIGECTQLHVTGGQDSVYLWKPAVGLSCTNCQNPFACPTETTTYWAIAVNFRGCRDSVSFTVVVHPKPVLVVNPNPVIICKHSTTTVTVSGAGVGGHYLWTPNVFIDCDTCATVVLSDTSNVVYHIKGTTAFGCIDSISVKVSVLDTNVNWISNDTIICIGDTIRLKATSQSLTSNLDIPRYTWSPDYNISNINVNNPLVWPAVTTVYTVSIRANQCFTKVLHTQVTVEPLPAITTVPGSATVIAGTSVQLLATAPNVVVSSFAWSPANTLSCDSCDNPIATPVGSVTVYTVTAVSNYGCVYYDTVSIHSFCDNSQVFIPNTFTPNGDGVNDRFFIMGKGISTITRFAIYNRWGQLIYEKSNINVNDAAAGWDGTFKGLVLPPDVFYYQVSATCELSNEPFTYTGDVSIVR